MKTTLSLALLSALTFARAETPATPPPWTTVLDEKIAGGLPSLMLNRFLLKQMNEAEAAIDAASKQLDSPEKLKAWQAQMRGKFVDALGGFPERTPLNAKVVETIPRDGYRIEKILFESRPKHFVTAALFLPDDKQFPLPFPGILLPCGHSKNGKAFDAYQRGCVLAARNGMAALIYDPIDQGERIQSVDENGKFKHSNVGGHNVTGVSADLLGWNTATFRIWDGMRALDYLAARKEIDPKKIGCMGNSGGGTLTAYLMALDDRIAAASPSCYITSLPRMCELIGPQDAEQNIFGQMAFGMNHAEFLLMRAPIPVLVACAQKDYFPLDGVKDAVARARSVGARLGFDERIARVESEGKHGWSEPLRTAATQWMSRWLRGKEAIAVPPLVDMGLTDEAMRVTERGQVMLLPGAHSVYDLMRDELTRLEMSRRKLSAEELRSAVRRCAGIRTLDALSKPKVESRGDVKRNWGTIRRLTLEVAPGLLLPALLFDPGKSVDAPILLVHGLGKMEETQDAEALAARGRTVLAVDLSGLGETQGSRNPGDMNDVEGKDEADAVIANLLGKTLVGMRAEEIVLCARWLKDERGAKSVELKSVSWAVTPALHAAVAEPALFSAVATAAAPMPWRDVIGKSDRHRFSDIVHGALREYDLDDLQRAISESIKAGN